MRLEVELVELVDYSGEETVRETKVLPLAEGIALKAEVDQLENKVAHLAIAKDDIAGYIFYLGEDIYVLSKDQEVTGERSRQPVAIATLEELKTATVYCVYGKFDSQDEEDKWSIEYQNYLQIKLPEGDEPSATRYRGGFRLISRTPIPGSEIEAAKAEVERLWSLAADKTLQAKEILAKLSPNEQEFLRKNLRFGIAPEED